MAPMTKMEIKKCVRREPPHPCDPPRPCDICDDDEGECPDPSLCLEKLLNPMIPHQTRCQPGAFVGVMPCKRIEPPHVCDPPPPCVPGKPPKNKCPDVALCFHRIKNPEPNFVICPDDDVMKYSFDLCDAIDILKTPLEGCTRDRCAPPPLLDPFDTEVPPPPPPPPPKKETSYQKTICDNLDDLKKSIVECFHPKCSPPIQIDPFKYEEEMQKLRDFPEDEDPCETARTKKR